MEYQEEFIDLLIDIEDEIESKEALLGCKDFIKKNLLEGTDLVQKVKEISRVDPNYEVFKETIDNLSNSLNEDHKFIFRDTVLLIEKRKEGRKKIQDNKTT